MKTGIELIAFEREEQIKKHGRTIDQDVTENEDGQLGWGAKALIGGIEEDFPGEWDRALCEKMINKPYKERLIIAGALIAAEIDRLNAQ